MLRKAPLSQILLGGRKSMGFSSMWTRGVRILATDGVDDSCIKIFQNRGHQVDVLKTLPEAELVKIIGDYEGLVVRSATKVNTNVIKAATNMRVVGRAGVGVDNIDVKECTKNGVIVMNTPGGNTVSTAQLALSLLASLARNLPAANMSIKEGKWDRKSFTGVELAGKTLGIVGYGRIGQVVASCAKTMGMNVLGFDPSPAKDGSADPFCKRVDLDQIWQQSDFITVHTPLTPETSNLINDKTISKCKKGVRIINCARGGIVDEAALLRGLQSGHVAGAALDVYTSEPPKEHLRPLIEHPNLICTPHLGASTDEAQVNVARDVATQMCDVFDEKEYVGVVNVSYLAASTQVHMKPFMTLAESLGSFLAQLSDARIVSVTLKTWGGRDVNITTKAARQLLEAKVLQGIVKNVQVGSKPDLISAPAMARDLRISSRVSEEAPDNIATPYWNLVSVEVERVNGTSSRITGAVFGDKPHIVKVDHFSDLFAFKPDGNYILTFQNEDKPGAVSKVLDLLHDAEVNVASVNVGRSKVAAEGDSAEKTLAMSFLSLDDDLSAATLRRIRELPFIQNVAKIQLRDV